MAGNSEEVVRNFQIMIQLEMESIQLQKKLIQANRGGRFNIHKIIVKEAMRTIAECSENIKIWYTLIHKPPHPDNIGNDIAPVVFNHSEI